MSEERKRQLIELHKASTLPLGSITDEEKRYLNQLVMADELEPFVLYHRHGQCDMNISRRAFEALKHLYIHYGFSPTDEVAKHDMDLVALNTPSIAENRHKISKEWMEAIVGEYQKGLIELDLFVREMYFSGKLLVDGMTYDEFNNSFATTEAQA